SRAWATTASRTTTCVSGSRATARSSRSTARSSPTSAPIRSRATASPRTRSTTCPGRTACRTTATPAPAWSPRKPSTRRIARPDGVRRIGVGLACYAQGTGLGPYEGATVRVDPSGKVYVYIGVTAQGQGHATTLAQIAAAELGAAWDDVHVSAGDTAMFPFGMGTGGSRVAANSGPAVAQTAREVRERAARVAAEILECAPEGVRIEQSKVHVVGTLPR